MVKTAELQANIRTEIVTKFDLGISVINIGKEYNLSRQTVYYQIKKYKNIKNINNLHRSGRNRKTTESEDRLILRQIKKDPLKTPKMVALEWNKDKNVSISQRTIRKRLKQHNFHTYVARNIPFISRRNIMKRLGFAKKYVNKPSVFWRNVLWTDESSFEYHSSPKKVFVRMDANIRKKLYPCSSKSKSWWRKCYVLG